MKYSKIQLQAMARYFIHAKVSLYPEQAALAQELLIKLKIRTGLTYEECIDLIKGFLRV